MVQSYRWLLQDAETPDARGEIAVIHLSGCTCTLDPFARSGTVQADTAAAAAGLADPAIHEAGADDYEYADCVLAALDAVVPAYAADLVSALDAVPMNANEKASVFRLSRHSPDSGALATLIRRARGQDDQLRKEFADMVAEWDEHGDKAAAADGRNDRQETVKHLFAYDQAAERIVQRLQQWLGAA
ncbi:hypothetical protein AB0F17_34405 [Nonomuraea sp. NPDC026600]|uniref:hypothetical protein n=1 Tax=Nonomuraea sp. NPDC026600 TaxID=3155363 RepID=UPI0033DEDCE0